jgi:hypothetical protein
MSGKSLSEIEAAIEQLDWRDQVRLLQYLAPRIAEAVLENDSTPSDHTDEAIARLHDLGERFAATSVPGAVSITDELTRARR